MKTAVLTILLITFGLCQSNTFTGRETYYCDSLMLAGEFQTIESFFIDYDSLFFLLNNPEYEDISRYNKLKNNYLSFIEIYNYYSSDLDSATHAQRFLIQRNLYHVNLAGAEANSEYEIYVEKLNAKEYKNALKSFVIADFLRRIFVHSKLYEDPNKKDFFSCMFDIRDLILSDNRKPTPQSSRTDLINLIVQSDVANAEVYLDNRIVGYTPLNVKVIEQGKHTLLVYKKGHTPYRRRINISDSVVTTINAVLGDAWIQLTEGPIGAEVLIDNEQVGYIPTRKLGVNAGTHNLRVQKALGYIPKTWALSFEYYEHKTFFDQLVPKKRAKAIVYSAIVPGLGQSYLQNKPLGLKFLLTEFTMVGGILIANRYINMVQQDYNNILISYEQSDEAKDILVIRDEIKHKKTALNNAHDLRKVFYGIAIGTWVWNILNAASYHEKQPIKISSSLIPGSSTYQLGLTFGL